MRRILFTAALVLLATGCFEKEADTGLLGRLPLGYDAYMTIDPEAADLQGILESVEDNISEEALRDIEESDIPLDPFDWQEWKDELGILDGEIGIVGLGEDMDFLALFLPCGDGEKLRDFAETHADDEVEFLSMDEYTVMVIEWHDDEDIEELEDALAGDPLSSSANFAELTGKAYVDDPAVSFLFEEEITEMPFAGFLSISSSETVLSVALALQDQEMEAYSGMFGDGLQSGSIMFPSNTMAAMRSTADMEWLASEYEDLAELSDADVRDIEEGLPFLGFQTMEEFLGVFRGDFCVALTEIEVDPAGEPSGGAGLMAISLTDSDKLEQTLSMVSAMAESDRSTVDGVSVYEIDSGEGSIWYFISDDVLYVTYGVEPGEVFDGISAESFFSGPSSEGFMGGAADPERLVRGLDAGADTEELVAAIFDERAEFTASFENGIASSSVTAGPDAVQALIALGLRVSE